MPQNTNIEKITLIMPDLKIGGAQRMFVNMAEWYADEGYEVRIVTLTSLSENSKAPVGQIKIPRNIKLIALQGPHARKNLFKLSRILKENDPDLVISGLSYINIITILAVCLARLQHAKLLVSERAYHSIQAKLFSKHYKLEKLLMRLLYPRAHKLVAISNEVAADIIETIPLHKDHVVTIYNPVITKHFAERLKMSPPQDNPAGKTIITCGRLDPVKDYPTLIKAFAELKNRTEQLSLVFLGDGPEKENLKKLSCELGVEENVRFMGFTDNPLPHFKQADLFVLTSLAEGFGNVIVEALYCGLPVIATNGPGGPKEILDNGKYGTLVPVGNISALAQAITESLDAPHAPEQLKARALEFSDDKICRQYLDVANQEKEGLKK